MVSFVRDTINLTNCLYIILLLLFCTFFINIVLRFILFQASLFEAAIESLTG